VSTGDDHLLRDFLAANDAPCPSCGYNLRGLSGASCPECNELLVLRVGLQEPRLGLWIAGLVGLAARAGFNGLLLVYLVLVMIKSGWRAGFVPSAFVVHNAVAGICTGAMLWFWMTRRARCRRCEQRTRLLLAVACWAVAALNVGIFAQFIR
jgi:hypothetical protein